MQHLEVSSAVRQLQWSLGVKRLNQRFAHVSMFNLQNHLTIIMECDGGESNLYLVNISGSPFSKSYLGKGARRYAFCVATSSGRKMCSG